MEFPIRINKYLAEKKIASRREADSIIEASNVLVNGKPAKIGQKINSTDTVTLTGKTDKKRYIAYYKPRGIITHSPAAHETDIKTKLREDYGLSGLAPIGRLDKDSEGLILLSDDGRITGPLLDPEADHTKLYSVSVDKNITPSFLKVMGAGVDIEGYLTKPAQIMQKGAKHFHLTLTEGKKHQIRRMCAALGYQVQSLKRIAIMHIPLGDLKPNQYKKITGETLARLLKDLNITN